MPRSKDHGQRPPNVEKPKEDTISLYVAQRPVFMTDILHNTPSIGVIPVQEEGHRSG
jgi:hypothetical protein